MNPHIIGIIMEGHRLKQRMQDEQMWLMGMYVQSAVATAVERNLYGHKARSKYIEQPLLRQEEKGSKNENSREEAAVFEMDQRIHILRQQGMEESPV